ncbi:MAG TPA: class I SAM-dependent methyltransferase [Pyrinomonadaceae bacterium]|nr:class I SAM-dependent methyltransferase [Pyrinomonadaceae bacterium]
MKAEEEQNGLVAEKRLAREQWSQDPCGAKYGAKYEFATRAFFDEVERHRYQEYAPWMPGVMGFDEFAGQRLLEVGCGMGTDLLQFARGGAVCTGVDLTPRSVEISSLHFGLYDLRADFVLADGERLPFADESFDVVYSNGVLHHTPDTSRAVRELHRVLRPGGIAKVMLYHRNSLYYWTEIILHRGLLRGHFLRGHSPEEIMSRYVEYSEHEARPLVKVYSQRQARKLFEPFREVRTEVEQMIREELRFLRPLVSEKMFRRLRQSAGWNVIITARK